MGFTLNQLEQERQIRKLQKKEDKDTKDYEQLSNLPKINDVELKGNKTTSDLGINADNVMMSDGVTSVEGAIDELKSELISQVAVNVTLPATTNGRSSIRIDSVIPAGAKVIGYTINNLASYSDSVSIAVYFITTDVRITMISNLNDVSQITFNLVVSITN